MFTNETLAGFDGVMFVSNSDEGVISYWRVDQS